MRYRKTSRILNDQAYFFGLSYNDISGIGVFLLGLLLLGKLIGVKSMLWALFVAIGALIFLIPIRIRFRRKILRDSIKYILTKGVIRVSKNSRK